MSLLLAMLLAAPGAAAPIRADALRAHMKFLASDLLEGRRTGTRGYDLAAAYVAARLEASGLPPAFGASYYQQVPFREGVVDFERSELLLRGSGGERRLRPRLDFLAFPNLALAEAEVEAPVVYVGFGVTAKQRGYDDYAAVDVRGKIVLMTSGAPAKFPSDERAHYSSTRGKRDNAATHGAVGILSFVLPEDQRRFPWERMTHELAKGTSGWRHADGRVEGARPELKAAAVLSAAEAELLFGGKAAFEAIVKAAEDGRPRSAELGITAHMRNATRHRDYESPNVVGRLEGSDAALQGEAVVFSAHLDHEGIGESRDGDAIWNGFFDNASGVATLLEIAKALASEPAPRRPILFLACVAEEEGLLGSDYFAQHAPLTPVANVNTDMFLAIHPLKEIVAFGAEHSSLGPIVREESGRVGFVLAADPFPRETIFIRSDQYPFVRRGVPAVMIAAGYGSRDSRVDGQQVMREWLQTRYHRPSDDAAQPVDWESLVRFAELNRRVGQRLAADPARPRWNDGDFFGRLFGGMP